MVGAQDVRPAEGEPRARGRGPPYFFFSVSKSAWSFSST